MTSSSSLSVAASIPPETRKHFAIHALAGSEPVSRVAKREGVSPYKCRFFTLLPPLRKLPELGH